MEVRGQRGRVHTQKGNKEKYSPNAREQEAAAVFEPSGPLEAGKANHLSSISFIPQRGYLQSSRKQGPVATARALGKLPPTPATEEELWRVRGSLRCELQWVGGVVGVGAATNAPSPTPQTSQLATCSWQLVSSLPLPG